MSFGSGCGLAAPFPRLVHARTFDEVPDLSRMVDCSCWHPNVACRVGPSVGKEQAKWETNERTNKQTGIGVGEGAISVSSHVFVQSRETGKAQSFCKRQRRIHADLTIFRDSASFNFAFHSPLVEMVLLCWASEKLCIQVPFSQADRKSRQSTIATGS